MCWGLGESLALDQNYRLQDGLEVAPGLLPSWALAISVNKFTVLGDGGAHGVGWLSFLVAPEASGSQEESGGPLNDNDKR